MLALHETELSVGGSASVAVTGVLGPADCCRVRQFLSRHLATSSVVVVDTSRLRLQAGVNLRFFSDALVRAGGWPAATLILVGPDERLRSALTTSRVARDVVLCDGLDEVEKQPRTRPERVVHRRYLNRQCRSIARAVGLVGSLGHQWQAVELVDDARHVTRALVTHTVLRARTRSALQVSLDPEGMRIAVRDFDAAGAAAIEQDLDAFASRASSWGVIPRADGKVTWALVGLGETSAGISTQRRGPLPGVPRDSVRARSPE